MYYWGDTSGAQGGILASTVIGVYLNIFDILYLRLYSHFPLIGERLDGARVKLDFDMNLHF